jgi:hypothetical protein
MTSYVCLRFAENDGARTAADVRARAAQVRAFRDRVWPSQPPRLAKPPAAQSARIGRPTVIPLAALPAPSEASSGRITVRRVLKITAAYFGITAADLLSDRRTKPLCRRRQIAMHVARRLTGSSLPSIGMQMGGRDHTTILHGVRTVEILLDNRDEETVIAVNAIVKRLAGEAPMTGAAHDVLVHVAEADGATFRRGSEPDRWAAYDKDGAAIVSDAMSIAEASRLYCEDKGLTPVHEVLARIVAEYRPYDIFAEFWEGFAAYLRHHAFGLNLYADGNGVKAQAWDRGANAAMQYELVLSHVATTPAEASDTEPSYLARLLQTGRC